VKIRKDCGAYCSYKKYSKNKMLWWKDDIGLSLDF